MCAFISPKPVEDVLDAFEELATAMPQHQGMDELLTYFEHTLHYIRGRRHNYGSALFPVSVLQATAGSKRAPSFSSRTSLFE